jgi:hypothetical protein
MDETGKMWRNFFASWPERMQQVGVVVASNSDQVPFISFLMAEHVIMLERPAPDTLGARKIVMPYSKIESVKITEPVGNDVFIDAGFIESRPKPS